MMQQYAARGSAPQPSHFVTGDSTGFTGSRALAPFKDGLQRFFQQFTGDEQRKDAQTGRFFEFSDLPTLLSKSEQSVQDVFYSSFTDVDGWWKRAATVQRTTEWNTTLTEYYSQNVPFDRVTQEVPPRMVSIAQQTRVKGLQEYRLGVYTHLQNLMTPEGVRMWNAMVAALQLDLQLTFKMNLVEAYRESESFFQALWYRGVAGTEYDSILSAYEMERSLFLCYNRDNKAIYRICARMQQLFASASPDGNPAHPNLTVIPSSAAAYIPLSGNFENEPERRGYVIAENQLRTGRSVALNKVISGFEVLVEQAQVGFNARLQSHSISFVQRAYNGQVWMIDGAYPSLYVQELKSRQVPLAQLLSVQIPTLHGPQIIRWNEVIDNALPIPGRLPGTTKEQLGSSLARAVFLEHPQIFDSVPMQTIFAATADVPGGFVRSAPALYYHFFGAEENTALDTAAKDFIRTHVDLVAHKLQPGAGAVDVEALLKNYYGKRFPEHFGFGTAAAGGRLAPVAIPVPAIPAGGLGGLEADSIYYALAGMAERIVNRVMVAPNVTAGISNELRTGWVFADDRVPQFVWQTWLPFGDAAGILPRNPAAGTFDATVPGRDKFSLDEAAALAQQLWGRAELPRDTVLRELLIGMSEQKRVITLAFLLCNGMSALDGPGPFGKPYIQQKNAQFIDWMKNLVELDITPPYASVLLFSPYQGIDTHGQPFLRQGGAMQKWGFEDTSLALNVYTLGILLNHSVCLNAMIMSNREHFIMPHVFFHGRPTGFGTRIAKPNWYWENPGPARARMQKPETNPDSIFAWAMPGAFSLNNLKEAQALQFFGVFKQVFIPYQIPYLERGAEEFFGGHYFGTRHFGPNMDLTCINNNRAPASKYTFDEHDKDRYHVSGLCFPGSAKYFVPGKHRHSLLVVGTSHLAKVDIDMPYHEFFMNQIPTVDDKFA